MTHSPACDVMNPAYGYPSERYVNCTCGVTPEKKRCICGRFVSADDPDGVLCDIHLWDFNRTDPDDVDAAVAAYDKATKR